MRRHFWLAIAGILLASAAPAFAAPVATTPTADFYEPGRDRLPHAPASTAVTAPQVIATAEPLASAAGAQLLAAGGNAADAALATMIALTVVEPQSSGLGGGAFLVWHDGQTGATFTIDGREKAPAAARPDRFLLADGQPMPFTSAVPGGYSVGVPGTLAVIAEAHRRWGTRPWAELFQPAIALARDGFAVTPRLHEFSVAFAAMLRKSPAAAAIFLDADGAPWPVGHLLRQPELAATLDKIARGGPGVFYRGEVGAKITAAVANAFAHPADLSANDLAAYRAVVRAPVCAAYRAWKLCTMGPPSSGGIAVLQILLQLERFDLKALGPDNLLAQHLFAESQRLAYADRAAYGADSDFEPVPVQGLLAPDYIRRRSALIRLHRAMPTVAPGAPAGAPARPAQQLADIPATTHLVAADLAGNVASITSTIEGPFGSGLMAAGFLLNNELTDFNFVPTKADGESEFNAVQPGKRPRSSMAPVIVYDRAGRPVAAFGAAGGATIIAQVAKALIGWLDWGLSVEDSIALPQLIADARGVRYEKGSRLQGMAAGLMALGHQPVVAAVLPLKTMGLVRTGKGWRGAADPRSDGEAWGVDADGRIRRPAPPAAPEVAP